MGENEIMSLLHLPLKAKWYNMIESGEKTEEYRVDKPYWRKRLMQCYIKGWCDECKSCKQCPYYSEELYCVYTHVCFRYGYTRKTMIYPIKELIVGQGNPEWGAPKENVFIIKFDNQVKIEEVKEYEEKNCKQILQ